MTRDGQGEKPPTRVVNVGGIADVQTQRATELGRAVDWIEVFEHVCSERWRGGLLQVNGAITDHPDDIDESYQYALIEVRLVGYIGGSANVIRRGVLGGDAGPIIQVFEAIHAYTRITVEARKIVDGVAGAAERPLTCEVSVIARFVQS